MLRTERSRWAKCALNGRNVPGTVKIFTTLGDVIVDAPIHVGLTGSYRGALRYDGGPVALGDARVALDIIEKSGKVSVRVDSNQSLLFPASEAGDATGSGSYTASAGLDFVVGQRVDVAFGGARNHLGRDVGRRIAFSLKPTAHGSLEGSFQETLHGLFANPVQLTGKAYFDFRPTAEDPVFTLGHAPVMPVGNASPPLSPTEVFGWKDASCGCLGVPVRLQRCRAHPQQIRRLQPVSIACWRAQ